MKNSDKVEIAYQNNDIIMKLMAEEFKDKTLAYYGLDLPKIVTVVPTELPVLQVKDSNIDFMFLLEDESLLHLEFQTTNKKADLKRFMFYDARLYNKETRIIRTVVIYSGKITEADRKIDAGSIKYEVEQVFMYNYDGNKVYEELNNKIEDGKKLSDEDKMNLIFLPLMKSDKNENEMAIKAIELAKKVENEEENLFLIGALIGITDKFIDKEYVKNLLEVLDMTRVGELLEKRGEKRGERRGEKRGAKKGKVELLINQLKIKLDSKLTKNYIGKIKKLDDDKLDKIGNNIFNIESIDDLKKYFD